MYFYEALRSTLYPCIFGYWNGDAALYLSKWALGHRRTALTRHKKENNKVIKNIPVFAASLTNICRSPQPLITTMEYNWLTLSIHNSQKSRVVSTTNITRYGLASAVGQRRQCRWVQRVGSNGNPSSVAHHPSIHPVLRRSISCLESTTLYGVHTREEYDKYGVRQLVVIVDYQGPSIGQWKQWKTCSVVIGIDG